MSVRGKDLAAEADELSLRRQAIRAAGRRKLDSREYLSLELEGGVAVVEPMTVDQLQEAVLTVLADGGFADKRTPGEAWEHALAAARLIKRRLQSAHEELVRLGQPRGVLGLGG